MVASSSPNEIKKAPPSWGSVTSAPPKTSQAENKPSVWGTGTTEPNGPELPSSIDNEKAAEAASSNGFWSKAGDFFSDLFKPKDEQAVGKAGGASDIYADYARGMAEDKRVLDREADGFAKDSAKIDSLLNSADEILNTAQKPAAKDDDTLKEEAIALLQNPQGASFDEIQKAKNIIAELGEDPSRYIKTPAVQPKSNKFFVSSAGTNPIIDTNMNDLKPSSDDESEAEDDKMPKMEGNMGNAGFTA